MVNLTFVLSPAATNHELVLCQAIAHPVVRALDLMPLAVGGVAAVGMGIGEMNSLTRNGPTPSVRKLFASLTAKY
ncbi:MAG: hypothetical protein ACFB12_18235 [Leptolyngbyaceae cyanobacterium]